MTIADSEGHIYSTNSSSLLNPILIILFFLLVLELFSACDSTLFNFYDTPNQHLKLFFDREEIGNYFVTNGGIVTNVDRDMLELTYLVSYYNYEYNGSSIAVGR